MAGDSKFPRGKLNTDDEGQIQMGVTVDQDCVVIAFPSPVTWFAMPAELADQLAETLKTRAAEARRNRQ